MNYRINPRNGDKLSLLAFGCMRFNRDFNETERQILYAIENGVNYFDTAYIYINSEETLGKIIAKNNLRDKIKIATKIPHYFVKKYEDFDKIFNVQLSRLKTDRIDYYLVHMLSDIPTLDRILDLGFEDWVREKKEKKQILNIGFSYHGNRQDFPLLLDAFEWDFCMIQFNYMDENNQAAKSGLEYASSKNLPVMIMEPLRGGLLATGLPSNALNVFKNAYIQRSPAEWAFRWVYDFPQVTSVLSGMNSFNIIKENIAVASNSLPKSLIDKDREIFTRVKGILDEHIKVPCTSCNYCMPCPAGVDIPACFSTYNTLSVQGKLRSFINYLMLTSLKSKTSYASKCVRCGKCEKHCPQKIQIMSELKKVSKALEPIFFKPLISFLKLFMRL